MITIFKSKNSGLFALIANVFFMFLAINLSAQDKSKDEKTTSITGASANQSKLSYKVPFKIPVSVFNKFRLSESTKVKRIYSDSTSIEYTRNTTYYYHLRAISFPEEGFQKVFASIDSMEYEFQSGKKIVKFDDQDDESMPPLHERDFLLFIQPLGKTFQAIYSNYGQVARIEGEDLDEKRTNIKNDIPKYENPERLVAILDKLSDQELIKIIDPLKNILPTFKVNFDTTWSRNIDLNLDVFKVKGDSKVKLNDYRNNNYQLLATMDSLTTDQKTFRLPDMNKEADLLQFMGKGTYSLDISNAGAPSYGKAELYYELKGKITNNEFYQTSQTTLIWDLMARTSY